MGEKRNAYTVWGGKSAAKDQLEDTCVHRGNIKMDLKEIGSEGMDWIHLTHDREKIELSCTQKCTFEYHNVRGIS
jgi:hypothetical protein